LYSNDDLFYRLLLCSYVNQSPVPPVRSSYPPVYPTLNTTNANPFDENDDDDDDDDDDTSLKEKSTTNR